MKPICPNEILTQPSQLSPQSSISAGSTGNHDMAPSQSTKKTNPSRSDRDYVKASVRGLIAERTEPRVKSAHWNADALVMKLRDGVTVTIPRRKIPGLAGASADALVDFGIEGGGAYLHWGKLDVDHSVPVLLANVLGVVTAREAARRAGSVSSPKKAAAAALNGRKGGRPPARHPETSKKKRKIAA
jgi:hypothetical protein